MFKTKMTELFEIKHPIMLAGMNWITEPELVSAVSNTGGLCIPATTHFTPKETHRNIKKIKELLDKPFGINQHLVGPGAKEKKELYRPAALCLESSSPDRSPESAWRQAL